jgi:Family of unknown function (DUF5343)
MAVQQDSRGAYGSTGSIIKVIEKHRQMGLPTMSLQRLQQIGVTEALAPRTLHTLTFLGFYDDSGHVTPEFDALRHAQDHDFKPRLAALLQEAYAPILEVLDPATATPQDVENAFRGHGYLPTGQLPRMVQLFMGLMIYAGLMPEDRRKATGGSQAGPRTPKVRPAGERGPSREPAGAGAGREPRPERPAPEPSGPLDGGAPERRDIPLGDAGSVTVTVNVRWLDLTDDQFTKLRKLIKDIEALGDSGSGGNDRTEVAP